MAVYSADSLGKVKRLIRTIRKTRRLPLPGEVIVKVGDSVEPDTPVARIAVRPGIPWVVPAARLLGIKPDELSKSMLVSLGDKVKTKDILARAEAGLYGRKELPSPCDGTIEEISDLSGRVTIREEFTAEDPPVTFDVAFELRCKPAELAQHMLRQTGQEVKQGQMIAKKGDTQAFLTTTAVAPVSGVISKIDLKSGEVTISRPFKQVVATAYIQGKVVEIVPRRGCIVETAGVALNGIFGLGRETHGELKVLTDGPSQVLVPEMITPDCEGKVIVGGSFATNEALAKAVAVGVRGVITGTVNYFNLTQSLGVKLGVGITGQEDVGITVILMEGFGHLNMRDDAWNTLKALEGRVACINGATQIRAGAQRPEIIVPFPEAPPGSPLAVDIAEELKVGFRVRVVSEPYFGEVGEISEIVREPMQIQTEARVPVIRVLLDGGRTVVIPRANVEVF